MISVKYSTLFSVELLHKFFTNQLCKDFTIIPSVQTVKALSAHKIIVKQYPNLMYAGMHTDVNGKPFIVPKEGMQLTFFLKLNNPLFFNYTNLPFSFSSGKLYYFTNRNTNSSNGKNFLSIPNTYTNTITYKPGDLAVNAAGTVFEAIRTSTGVVPPADGIASDFWMQVDAGTSRNRYMSEGDALQWLPPKSTYSFTTLQSSVSVQVLGYNAAVGDYSSLLLSNNTNYTDPVSSFTLDLSALPQGKYKMTINGIEQSIYLTGEPAAATAFAVIDIYFESSLSPLYQILDGANNFKSPLYSIYFLNRSTIWNYVFANGAVGGITDNAGIYQFTPALSGSVFSTKPIPLNETALDLKVSIGVQNYSPIECASPQRLAGISLAGDAYNRSEIFLNYSS